MKPKSLKRVVVTGIGAVCPLGTDSEIIWKRIVNAEHNISRITYFDPKDYQCQIAGQVPYGEGENQFNPSKWIEAHKRHRVSEFILYSLEAAKNAIDDSQIDFDDDWNRKNTGVAIGSGTGGLDLIQENSALLKIKGARRLSPFLITGSSINMAAGFVAIKNRIEGPNFACATACSSGSHSIATAANMIATGEIKRMLAGGAEASICEYGIACFLACRAMTRKYNDTPHKASRPFDKNHDGFVMGEGAAILVLEELETARSRNAKIYAELLGVGMSCDANHITAPPADGRGAFVSMQRCVKNSNIDISQIQYINAHGTSTPSGDEAELYAIGRLFDDYAQNVSVSSTKSSIGHLLGASGAIEALFSVLAIRDGVVPPTLNLHEPVINTKLDLVALKAKRKNIDNVLSNSFGFGGTNITLAFGKL